MKKGTFVVILFNFLVYGFIHGTSVLKLEKWAHKKGVFIRNESCDGGIFREHRLINVR